MKYFVGLLFSVLLLLGSCDKCSENSCRNGGVCVDDVCECPFEYDGKRCKEETRSQYTGFYDFILYVPFQEPDSSVIYVDKSSSNPKRMMVGEYAVELTSRTEYILPEQIVNGVQTTGNGEFILGGFTGEITVYIGGFPVTSTYVGEER